MPGPPVAPGRAHGAEVIGEGEGGSTAVLARNHRDAPVGQVQVGVGGPNARVGPRADPASENLGADLTAEPQRSGKPGHVVGEHDDTRGDRHQPGAGLRARHLLVAERRVAGTEIDRIGQIASLALAAAHGLVRDDDVRVLPAVGLDPLLVQRGREGRAGPAKRYTLRGSPARDRQRGGREPSDHQRGENESGAGRRAHRCQLN